MAAEKNFENRLKKFLESEGCWFVKFFANAYTKSGIPDLLVCCNGYFVAVEVKAPNGKPSELQKLNIRRINEAHGIGIVLYPDQFDDFKEMVKWLNADDRSNNVFANAIDIADRINERWASKCK
jgi:hypothetical protein